MDFTVVPPEINSARMYAGPGAGPMLAAATAWNGLAAELHAVGASYESAISELAGGWSGPSETTMAAAATPYVTWMHHTATQAEQTATQAKAAAAAYEAAFIMTVPPPVIAANRSQLAALLATNLLGQNTAAIAATEAHYVEMWAQDATAMSHYAGAAAAASALTPFSEPPQTTNAAGATTQATAVGQATATAAGSHAAQLSAVPNALQSLTSPATTAVLGATSPVGAVPNSVAAALAADPAVALAVAGLGVDLFGTGVIDSAGTFGIDVIGTFGIDAIGIGEIGAAEGLLPFASFASSTAPITAGLGQAASLGALSVPQAWTVAAPSVVSQVSLASAAGSLAAPTAGESTIPFAEMATAGVAGRALAGAVGRGRGAARTVPTRKRSVSPEQPPRSRVQSIGADLRELAELREAGLLTEEEFTEEKRRLLAPAQ